MTTPPEIDTQALETLLSKIHGAIYVFKPYCPEHLKAYLDDLLEQTLTTIVELNERNRKPKQTQGAGQ
jgi:hypothetical protein